jgi:hypothetical protein
MPYGTPIKIVTDHEVDRNRSRSRSVEQFFGNSLSGSEPFPPLLMNHSVTADGNLGKWLSRFRLWMDGAKSMRIALQFDQTASAVDRERIMHYSPMKALSQA